MPPKKRKSTTKAANGGKKKKVDTEFYVVEQIKSNKLEGKTVNYTVKWENWAEKHNTDEPEPRLLCDKKLLDFAKKAVMSSVNLDIEKELNSLDTNNPADFLKILDPLATIALTTVFTGSVKFVCWDSVTSKVLFLKYLRDYNQSYLLRSYIPITDEELDHSFEKYSDQFRHRLEVFPESPIVEFKFPLEGRSFFYAPPPLSNLLFEPVDKNVLDVQPKHFFPPNSSKQGFNQTQPFLHSSYFQTQNAEQHVKYSNIKRIGGMNRQNFEDNPRFKTNLVVRQEIGRGLVLRVAEPVKENTPLLMMTGVIRPERDAHKSLIDQGERVAFSSFINIPEKGFCLDRRQYHDFSKYIAHNCNPSCSVRLVDSGNNFPDLVVYSTRELSLECDISIDFFKAFEADVEKYFEDKPTPDGKLFDLYEGNVDFVHCQCGSFHCRDVLYVDRSLKKADKSVNKKDKLADLDPMFMFGGMEVAETDKIWTITNQEFVA